MILDSYDLKMTESLYQLIMECKDLGGFKEKTNGQIEGVFYKPLLKLAKEHGLNGGVYRKLSIRKIIKKLLSGNLIILSVNKNKIDKKLDGGHLVLIYDYSENNKSFYLHDPDKIISRKGRCIRLKSSGIINISNFRGIAIKIA
jgi:hypothetical protein